MNRDTKVTIGNLFLLPAKVLISVPAAILVILTAVLIIAFYGLILTICLCVITVILDGLGLSWFLVISVLSIVVISACIGEKILNSAKSCG